MAEETTNSAVGAAEPPKVNPLAAKPLATVQMKPVIRKPAIGGALKPGLKLPPKPAAASPLKTVTPGAGLKSPLKMPAAPALKPGLKLPTKPVIRKPGALGAASPLPKPAVPVAAKPLAAPVAAPVATPVAAKPVAAPVAPKPVAPSPEGALGALKAVTQNLKNISAGAETPQRALLHKTGILADPSKELTEAQKQAAKSKTARISLSEAVGVAPVKNENAPMKTIRIKRPVGISPNGPAPAAPVAATVVAPVAAPVAEAKPAEKNDVSLTQRKTLKISRPSGLTVRPAGKFGVNKPAASTAPAAPALAPVADVADIPDIPDMPAASLPPVSSGDTVADVPAVLGIIGVVVQVAACVAMGALAWFLYQDVQIPLF